VQMILARRADGMLRDDCEEFPAADRGFCGFIVSDQRIGAPAYLLT